MVQFHPGSLHTSPRSVGALAALRRGKAGDRVRFPDGPLALNTTRVSRAICGLACSKGATDPCKLGVVGSIPTRSTHSLDNGSMVKRTIMPRF